MHLGDAEAVADLALREVAVEPHHEDALLAFRQFVHVGLHRVDVDGLLDRLVLLAEHVGEQGAAMMCAVAGAYTFHHDPGELSAAFVWPRFARIALSPPPPVRYVIGAWGALVDALAARARELGARIETGHRVEALPEPPVIVATELGEARALLGDPRLSWTSGHTVCLDLGLRHRRGDPSVVSDMDESGWIGRYSTTNPSIAPDG